MELSLRPAYNLLFGEKSEGGIRVGEEIYEGNQTPEVSGDDIILFVDRDGTMIVEPRVGKHPNAEIDYQVTGKHNFEFVDGFVEAVRELTQDIQKNIHLVMITNQDGLRQKMSKPLFWLSRKRNLPYNPEAKFREVNAWIYQALKDAGVSVLAELTCPHDDHDGCKCRKPETGMTDWLKEKFPQANLSTAIMVGNSSSSDGGFAVNMSIPWIEVNEEKGWENATKEIKRHISAGQ